jgi:hypothetical protein
MRKIVNDKLYPGHLEKWSFRERRRDKVLGSPKKRGDS